MFERGIRDFEIIERWGIVRAHRRGSVAAHSHRVAIYADQIAEFISWKGDRAALLRFALWHDAFELVTGDMPGPVKRMLIDPVRAKRVEADILSSMFPGMEWTHPGPEVCAIVKVADCIDELLWLIVEFRMGNDMLQTVMNDSAKRLEAKMKELPCSILTRAMLEKELQQVIDDHEDKDPQAVVDFDVAATH